MLLFKRFAIKLDGLHFELGCGNGEIGEEGEKEDVRGKGGRIIEVEGREGEGGGEEEGERGRANTLRTA